MHMICETMPEFHKLKKISSSLSEGDSAYVRSVSRRYVIQNGEFVLSIDYKEHQREFRSKKEKEEFTSTLTTPEAIASFLTEHAGEESCPWRFIAVAEDLFRESFAVMNSGMRYYQEGIVGDKVKNNRPYQNFEISLNRDRPITEKVLEEFMIIWNAQRKWHPAVDQLSFGIFEHTLSAHGSWGLKISVGSNGSPGECSVIGFYGRKICFSSIKDALEYIAKNHWYDDDEETVWDNFDWSSDDDD